MALRGTKQRAAKAKANSGKGKGGRNAQPASAEREPSESGEEEVNHAAMPERSDSEVYSKVSMDESDSDDAEEEDEEASEPRAIPPTSDAAAFVHPPQANGLPPASLVDAMKNGRNCWLCERPLRSMCPPFDP